MGRKRQKRIRPLKDLVMKGQPLSANDTRAFFADLRTRLDAFQLLFGYDQLQAVPKEYNDITSSAEGQLAVWLEFPTELDAQPDEIKYMGRCHVGPKEDGYEHLYEVFKFRMDEPHWNSRHGWTIGWAGPFEDDSMFPTEVRAFSRFATLKDSDPEQEVRWYDAKIMCSTPLESSPMTRFTPAN